MILTDKYGAKVNWTAKETFQRALTIIEDMSTSREKFTCMMELGQAIYTYEEHEKMHDEEPHDPGNH